MIQRYYETAKVAAEVAGEILKESFGKRKEISFKGRIDLVTDVDYKSEKAILEIIKSRHPDHDVITEESQIDLTGSEYRWIIDPLDGTVNYAHDYPFVAVSIALEIKKSIEVGIVYNPIMNEFFHAVRGQGAFLWEKPVKVSGAGNLEKSFLATGFPYDIRDNEYNNLAYFNNLIMHAQAIRRDGSAALDLCYLAMGRFDGFWEIHLSPWDIAAGKLIVEEAGGRLSDFEGGGLSVYNKEVLATNGIIHNELLEKIIRIKSDVYGQ